MRTHLDDVLSDLSAIHRLSRTRVTRMTAPEFFSLAVRLVHHHGSVRAELERQVRAHEDAGGTVTADRSAGGTAAVLPLNPDRAEREEIRDRMRRRRLARRGGDVRRVEQFS